MEEKDKNMRDAEIWGWLRAKIDSIEGILSSLKEEHGNIYGRIEKVEIGLQKKIEDLQRENEAVKERFEKKVDALEAKDAESDAKWNRMAGVQIAVGVVGFPLIALIVTYIFNLLTN